MQFSKPTLQDISTQIQSDIASRLGISLPIKKKSVLSALSFAMSGSLYLLYGTIEKYVSQWFIDTAKGVNLDRLAGFYGMKRRGKTQANGNVRFDGPTGTLISKGIRLSNSSGATYTVLNDTPISDPGVRVIADEAGANGNLDSGAAMTLITSIANVKAVAVVLASQIIGGFDDEDDDTFRARILRRLRHPGQGGTESDYRHWAQEVAGVGNVWVTPDPTNFSIRISCLTVDPEHTVPSPEHVAQVNAYLQVKKPLGTRVYTQAPDAFPITFEVLIRPEDKAQTLLENAFKQFFLRRVSPGTRIPLVQITQLTASVLKHDNFKVTSPATDISTAPNQIATFGGLKCSSMS